MKALATLLLFISLSAMSQDQKYFFVFLNKKTDKAELPKEEVDKLMQGHMANIERLAKEGKLIAAGPFDGGGGIFIFKASSLEQTKDWLSTDPGIKANRWDVEVLPYSATIGGVCTAVEPYVMLSYEFVRYTRGASFSAADQTEKMKKHALHLQNLVKGGNIITAGVFENEGGILVMKGELNKEQIEADPTIREGQFQTEYKKLYIAKGSFCEP